MAEVKDEVMEMVREELDRNPDVENKDLYEKATEVDSSISDLTLRQFHARYPLQVKRQKAQKSGGGKKTKATTRAKTASGGGSRGGGTGSGVDRDRIRATLLQFAKDVSAAEGQASSLIDVLDSVDDYVDQVVRAANGGR